MYQILRRVLISSILIVIVLLADSFIFVNLFYFVSFFIGIDFGPPPFVFLFLNKCGDWKDFSSHIPDNLALKKNPQQRR